MRDRTHHVGQDVFAHVKTFDWKLYMIIYFSSEKVIPTKTLQMEAKNLKVKERPLRRVDRDGGTHVRQSSDPKPFG